jgi:hypothetical protein
VYDSLCSTGEFIESNRVALDDPPRVRFREPQYCATDSAGAPAHLAVDLHDGKPPFTVHWSDGVVTTSSNTWMVRSIVPSGWSSEVSIVKATTAGCDAKVPLKGVMLYSRPSPYIERDRELTFCDGAATVPARIARPMSPEVRLTWSITNGEIVSGQGTSSVTVRPAATGTPRLQVDATYADGFCTSSNHADLTRAGMPIMELRMDPPAIPAGGKAHLVVKRNVWVYNWAYKVLDASRGADLRQSEVKCDASVCRIPFVDTHGPGEVTITASYSGLCGVGVPQTVKLLIEP